MADSQLVAVTYTGTETPFLDRIYRSRLTFDPNQTRQVPAELATKFLLHADVFKAADENAAANSVERSEEPSVPKDDTQEQLEGAKKAEDERRQKENQRFELHQQIDKMDKQALRDWTKTKFQQDLPGNLGVEKMRDRVKGFVDQYGAP
jgi:transposase